MELFIYNSIQCGVIIHVSRAICLMIMTKSLFRFFSSFYILLVNHVFICRMFFWFQKSKFEFVTMPKCVLPAAATGHQRQHPGAATSWSSAFLFNSPLGEIITWVLVLLGKIKTWELVLLVEIRNFCCMSRSQ